MLGALGAPADKSRDNSRTERPGREMAAKCPHGSWLLNSRALLLHGAVVKCSVQDPLLWCCSVPLFGLAGLQWHRLQRRGCCTGWFCCYPGVRLARELGKQECHAPQQKECKACTWAGAHPPARAGAVQLERRKMQAHRREFPGAIGCQGQAEEGGAAPPEERA